MCCGLVGNERKALESDDLQVFVLLGEPLGYSSLIAVAELELLVDEAAFLEELLDATLGDVLDHRHLEVCLALDLCIGDDLASLVGLLLGEPALGGVRLD